jgi:hypothetical protein
MVHLVGLNVMDIVLNGLGLVCLNVSDELDIVGADVEVLVGEVEADL